MDVGQRDPVFRVPYASDAFRVSVGCDGAAVGRSGNADWRILAAEGIPDSAAFIKVVKVVPFAGAYCSWPGRGR